ncbi:MAG: hypothetical protein AAFV01_10590, partial [Bacteroidota bacterium]
ALFVMRGCYAEEYRQAVAVADSLAAEIEILELDVATADSVFQQRSREDSLAVEYWQSQAETAQRERDRARAQALAADRRRERADRAMVSAETTADSLAAALDALRACDDGRHACERHLDMLDSEVHACTEAATALQASIGACRASLVVRDQVIDAQADELDVWRTATPPPTLPSSFLGIPDEVLYMGAGAGLLFLLSFATR